MTAIYHYLPQLPYNVKRIIHLNVDKQCICYYKLYVNDEFIRQVGAGFVELSLLWCKR